MLLPIVFLSCCRGGGKARIQLGAGVLQGAFRPLIVRTLHVFPTNCVWPAAKQATHSTSSPHPLKNSCIFECIVTLCFCKAVQCCAAICLTQSKSLSFTFLYLESDYVFSPLANRPSILRSNEQRTADVTLEPRVLLSLLELAVNFKNSCSLFVCAIAIFTLHGCTTTFRYASIQRLRLGPVCP
jgi:hypothetical protein